MTPTCMPSSEYPAWNSSKGLSQISDANLHGADLRGAYLSGANLSDADLSFAILALADLGLANLSNVNLRNTFLKGAIVTPEQLDAAKTLQDATMPDESIYTKESMG